MRSRHRLGDPVPFHTRLRPAIQRRLKIIAAMEGKHMYRVVEDALLAYFPIHHKWVQCREAGNPNALLPQDLQLMGGIISLDDDIHPDPLQSDNEDEISSDS